MTATTPSRRRIPAIVLPLLLIPACNDAPAPATPPAPTPTPTTAPADPRAVADQRLSDAARRNVGQFRFAVYRYLDQRIRTGVIFSVPPARQPTLDNGFGVVLIHLTEQQAERIIDKLAQERLLRQPPECRLVGRPEPPYYLFAGSAGRDCEFYVAETAGPAIERRLESYAALLDWPARDALRNLFTAVGQPEAAAGTAP